MTTVPPNSRKNAAIIFTALGLSRAIFRDLICRFDGTESLPLPFESLDARY